MPVGVGKKRRGRERGGSEGEQRLLPRWLWRERAEAAGQRGVGSERQRPTPQRPRPVNEKRLREHSRRRDRSLYSFLTGLQTHNA